MGEVEPRKAGEMHGTKLLMVAGGQTTRRKGPLACGKVAAALGIVDRRLRQDGGAVNQRPRQVALFQNERHLGAGGEHGLGTSGDQRLADRRACRP